MKDRRKRAQREEVRKILATMRLELAAQRLAQDNGARAQTVTRLDELITRSKQTLTM